MGGIGLGKVSFFHRLTNYPHPNTPHKIIINLKQMNKDLEIRKDEKKVVPEVPKSEKFKAFKALIDAYKVQNPVKFEAKKEALEARLKELKG